MKIGSSRVNKSMVHESLIPKKRKLDYSSSSEDDFILFSVDQNDAQLFSSNKVQSLKTDINIYYIVDETVNTVKVVKKRKVGQKRKSGKNNTFTLDFRFKKTKKLGVYRRFKLGSPGGANLCRSSQKTNGGFIHGELTPKSKTPLVLVTPTQNTELYRKLVINGFDNEVIATYTQTPCEDNQIKVDLQTPEVKTKQINVGSNLLLTTPMKKAKTSLGEDNEIKNNLQTPEVKSKQINVGSDLILTTPVKKVKKSLSEDNAIKNDLQTPEIKSQQISMGSNLLLTTPVKKAKKIVLNRAKRIFLKQTFIPHNSSHSSKRKISQIQVMGESAKDAANKYISKITKPKATDKRIIKSFDKSLGMEWRHLKPYSICGESSQKRENLSAGTAHSNTIELCVEEAVKKISDIGVKLKVAVRESIFDGNIGKYRAYIIKNPNNSRKVKIKFSAWEINKPYLLYRKLMHDYICEQLDIQIPKTA